MEPTLLQQLNKNEDDFVEFYKMLLLQKICFEAQHDRPIKSFLQLYFKQNDIHDSLLEEAELRINQIKGKKTHEKCTRLLYEEFEAVIRPLDQHYSRKLSDSLNSAIAARQQNRAAAAIKKWNKKL